MSGGDFFERIDHLDQAVGHGDLGVKWTTDQVYAKYQELRDDLRHPRGGRAHYARDALLEHVDERLGRLAARAITPDGSDLVGGGIQVAIEGMHQQAEYTPREFVNLARSIEVEVTDDGEQVYHRPADVHRLSEAELRAQRRHGHRIDYGAETMPRLELP
jgi:hypothetical protein